MLADPFLTERLRPHQREGLKFIFECLTGLKKQGFWGGILCDGMGLGKTFQCVASLWTLVNTGLPGAPACRRPLVLCPSSLVTNWGKEFEKWLEDRVRPLVVEDTRANAVREQLADLRTVRSGRCRPQVLVMSYTTFRMHVDEVCACDIDLVFCDEAHQLKNKDAQVTMAVSRLPTLRRLLITGTPIQNDLSEFFALFHVALPGLLGDVGQFKKQYELPILRGREASATREEVEEGLRRMNQLMDICSTFMLRRTSTVLKSLLPPKLEQVVFCKMSALQLRLYQFFLHSPAVQSLLSTEKASGAAGMMLHPLAAITALKKLCCHPDLIYSTFGRPIDQRDSGIKMKSSGQFRPSAVLSGGARHPLQDITNALEPSRTDAVAEIDQDFRPSSRTGRQVSSGPMPQPIASGRAIATRSNLPVTKSGSKGVRGSKGPRQTVLTGFEHCAAVFSEVQVYPRYHPGHCQVYHSGKVIVLEALLKAIRQQEPTDKVVLVSNYTEALDLLQGFCASHQWSCLRLDGSCSVQQRQVLVDRFNDPTSNAFVFLVSSKAGGVGLNIIGANRLILFDPDWNPANDLQAMARVWREGQKKNVYIYRLLTTGSIEEKVFQRQLAKQGLSEALVDAVGQETRHFSRDELRGLFQVETTQLCDTHRAIRCPCQGRGPKIQDDDILSDEPLSTGALAGGEQDIMRWAHLHDAIDSPDPTWQGLSPWMRENFVTFVFSDHPLNGSPPQGAHDASQDEGVQECGGYNDGSGSCIMSLIDQEGAVADDDLW